MGKASFPSRTVPETAVAAIKFHYPLDCFVHRRKRGKARKSANGPGRSLVKSHSNLHPFVLRSRKRFSFLSRVNDKQSPTSDYGLTIVIQWNNQSWISFTRSTVWPHTASFYLADHTCLTTIDPILLVSAHERVFYLPDHVWFCTVVYYLRRKIFRLSDYRRTYTTCLTIYDCKSLAGLTIHRLILTIHSTPFLTFQGPLDGFKWDTLFPFSLIRERGNVSRFLISKGTERRRLVYSYRTGDYPIIRARKYRQYCDNVRSFLPGVSRKAVRVIPSE